MTKMSSRELRPGGTTFHRVGGREGHWHLHARRRDPSFPLGPDDDVVCPFEFVEVPGLEAEAIIEELRISSPGRTPILFGSTHEAGILFERRENRGKSAEQWLREAEVFDIDGWLAQRAMEFQAEEYTPRRGPWPEQATTYRHLTIPHEILVDEPKRSVIIGLLPTRDPTETAAYLGFGGWNDCPFPPVHVLLARRWHERYGAVQTTCTYETVEFQVAKPISSREEAMSLAMQQFYWCTDSTPETLEHAAAELIGSTVWVFWWD